VTIDANGEMLVRKDVIRPEDKAKLAKLPDPDRETADTTPAEKPLHSERLTRLLTAHRTLALQAELMRRPDVALVIFTHCLMREVFFPSKMGEDLAQISLTTPLLPAEVETGSAWAAIKAKEEELRARLPDESDEKPLLHWLLEQPQETVFEYMAFCVARSLDAVQNREQPSLGFIETAKAVNLNMGDWWQPTAGNYFSHVPKTRIAEVVTEAVSADIAGQIGKLKKAAAAEAAEKCIAATNWLPEVLRTT
jgi:ParB family transcriptional regulator, chromosome partitioning protein